MYIQCRIYFQNDSVVVLLNSVLVELLALVQHSIIRLSLLVFLRVRLLSLLELLYLHKLLDILREFLLSGWELEDRSALVLVLEVQLELEWELVQSVLELVQLLVGTQVELMALGHQLMELGLAQEDMDMVESPKHRELSLTLMLLEISLKPQLSSQTELDLSCLVNRFIHCLIFTRKSNIIINKYGLCNIIFL